MHYFLKFIFGIKRYMFRTFYFYLNVNQLDALNFIMSLFHYKIQCIKLVNIKINILRCTVSKISKNVSGNSSVHHQEFFTLHTANRYDICHCCVYSEKKTPDDGQRNCPKHVEFCSKNKFENLEYLVGFTIRI